MEEELYIVRHTINTDPGWTQLKTFKLPGNRGEEAIILYKYCTVGCVVYDPEEDNPYTYDENSVQDVSNYIVSVLPYNLGRVLILDCKGAVNCYICDPNDNYPLYCVMKIYQFTCHYLLSCCIVKDYNIMGLTMDKSGLMHVQHYNFAKRVVKSCPYIKTPLQVSKFPHEKYLIKSLQLVKVEVVFIACPRGSVVECFSDCSGTEIRFQFEDAVVDMAQIGTLEGDILFFLLKNGTVIKVDEYGVQSRTYLPHSSVMSAKITPEFVLYSDGTEGHIFGHNTQTLATFPVKGVVALNDTTFKIVLLTVQGLLYEMECNKNNIIGRKLKEFQALNSQLDEMDSQISAISAYLRTTHMKSLFLTRVRITPGELEKSYKFKLSIAHTFEDVTFDSSQWYYKFSVENFNITHNMSAPIPPEVTVHESFVLRDVDVSCCHIKIKMFLLGKNDKELIVELVDQVFTLFSFCTPVTSLENGEADRTLDYTQTVRLDPEIASPENFLIKSMEVIRHAFTEDAWNKVRDGKAVLLRLEDELLHLSLDDKNEELTIKCTKESLAKTAAEVFNLGVVQAGVIFSQYINLEGEHAQTEWSDFESGTDEENAEKDGDEDGDGDEDEEPYEENGEVEENGEEAMNEEEEGAQENGQVQSVSYNPERLRQYHYASFAFRLEDYYPIF